MQIASGSAKFVDAPHQHGGLLDEIGCKVGGAFANGESKAICRFPLEFLGTAAGSIELGRVLHCGGIITFRQNGSGLGRMTSGRERPSSHWRNEGGRDRMFHCHRSCDSFDREAV